MMPEQFVPIGEVAGDVLDLGDALAVRGVVGAPEAERVHVEVLAVEVDALLVDQLVDVLGEPFPGLRIAEVQQSAVLAAENPFGMVLGQPGAGRDPLRLEPDDDLHALGMGVVADSRKPLGKRRVSTSHVPVFGQPSGRRDTSRRPSTSSRASGPLRDSGR